MTDLNTLVPIPLSERGQCSWAVNHIMVDTATGEYVSFDEAALEHSRHPTLQEAISELEKYHKYLNSTADGM